MYLVRVVTIALITALSSSNGHNVGIPVDTDDMCRTANKSSRRITCFALIRFVSLWSVSFSDVDLPAAIQIALGTSSLQSENSLLLHFRSAQIIAKELEAKYGRVRAGSTNLGDPSRVYVRKAQYNWRCVAVYLKLHFS